MKTFKQFITSSNGSLKNTHIEHPEDSILEGDLRVLNWFTAESKISAKIDGSPAIVWGRNPKTESFFVGTKSVFNKRLIKINESHEDIDKNHSGNVASILHKCFDNLPRTDKIYQGDYIGEGGKECYKPNTITYYFLEKVEHNIIIAPHTSYTAKCDLRDAIAHPINDKEIISLWEDAKNVQFIRPYVNIDAELNDIIERCNFARQMSTMCEFVNSKTAANIKRQLNTCIREGLEIDDITLEALASDNNCDVNVLNLWKLVESIKKDMFTHIEVDDDIECYIEEERCGHEGYVMSNEFGTFKLVNREGFSKANFNHGLMRKRGNL
tara:strand:- start:113 stop:1087 length:975 start_codon:yes stop_codon:yes gene_type:complete